MNSSTLASLSITNSRSSSKPKSIESVMPSNHLILCCPFSSCPKSFPASGSFPMSQLFASGGQSIGVSPSTSVLPMNTQDWSPLEWTGWISFQSKGLSRVFSNTTVQKHQFFCAQLSLQGKAFLGLSRSEEGKKTVLIMELVVLCNGLLSSKRWLPKEIRTVWGN